MICFEDDKQSRIKFKKKLYHQDVKLNSGAYGNVYLFKSTTEDKLAVKYFKDDEGKEFKKEKYLLKTIGSLDIDTKKKVIDSYYSTVCRVIIMDYQHGSLNNVIPTINLKKKVDLFNQVLIAIIQLLEENLFYCDLKLENILYKSGSEGIKTCLGDVGSIILGEPFFEDSSKEWISVQEFNDSFNNQTYVFTFPYLDYKGTIIEGKITKSFILSFYQQILIFFILLTGLYSTWTPFWFETIKEGSTPIHLKTELETNDKKNLLERNDASSISILDEYFYPNEVVFLERFGKVSKGYSNNLFDEGYYNYGEIKERILSDLQSMHVHFSSAYQRLS